MNNIKNKFTFTVSALVYLLFNLRLDRYPEPSLGGSIIQTLFNLLETVPFVAGSALVVISFIQYMTGEKLPWDRRFRMFFLIGIMAGLFLGIWNYAGQPPA
ncbi:MAG: hypothetical protein CSB24_02460 [Deltaproteobacteria bacterium]|nr:MAG: hypothetical protein CSB24_02460 [Deltaproteobacteria bacterium]